MKFIKLFVVKNSKQLLSYSSFIQKYAKEHPLVAQAMAFMDKYSEIDEDDKSKVKMEKLAICFNQFNFQTTYEKFDKYFDVLHKKMDYQLKHNSQSFDLDAYSVNVDSTLKGLDYAYWQKIT